MPGYIQLDDGVTLLELSTALQLSFTAGRKLSRYGPVVKLQGAVQSPHPLVLLHVLTFQVYVPEGKAVGTNHEVVGSVTTALRTTMAP